MRNSKLIFGGFFLLAMLPLQGFTQVFSLKQAQDFAVVNNYSIRERDQEIKRSKAEVNEVISSGLPQVVGSASYNNFIRQPVQVIPAEFFGGEPGTFASVVFGTKQNLTLDLTASQLLFDGSYIIGLKAAREVVELSRMQKRLTKQEIKKAVYDAYAMVLAAEENYKTLLSSAETLGKIATQTEALKEAGLSDDIAVSQIKINLSNLENAVENAKTQIDLAKNLLKFQMGISLSQELILTSTLEEFTDFDISTFVVDAFSAKQTVEFSLARQNVTLQNFRLKAEKAGYLPRLSAFFNHQQNAFRQQFDFISNTDDYFTTNLVGFNLEVPIFTSFKKRNQIKQAKINVELAELNQTKVSEGMSLEIANAQAQLKNELNNFNTQKSNLELSELIREQTRTKYGEGLSSSFDLNQAETQYLEAQGKYISSIINLSGAKSTLEKILNQ